MKLLFTIILSVVANSIVSQELKEFFTMLPINIIKTPELQLWVKKNKVKALVISNRYIDSLPKKDFLDSTRGRYQYMTDKLLFSKNGYLTEFQTWFNMIDLYKNNKYDSAILIVDEKSKNNKVWHQIYNLKNKKVESEDVFDNDGNIISKWKKAEGEKIYFLSSLYETTKYDESKKITQMLSFGGISTDVYKVWGVGFFDTLTYQDVKYNSANNEMIINSWFRKRKDFEATKNTGRIDYYSTNIKEKYLVQSIQQKIWDTISIDDYLADSSILHEPLSHNNLNYILENRKDLNYLLINNQLILRNFNYLEQEVNGGYRNIKPDYKSGYVGEFVMRDSSKMNLIFDFRGIYFYNVTPYYVCLRKTEYHHGLKVDKFYAFCDLESNETKLIRYLIYDRQGRESISYHLNKDGKNLNHIQFNLPRNKELIWNKEEYFYTDGILSKIKRYKQKLKKDEKDTRDDDPLKVKYRFDEVVDYSKFKNIIYLNKKKDQIMMMDQVFSVEYWK